MEGTESLARRAEELRRATALSQGAYYVATGLWPILHLNSFMAVTGPKHEGWLVKTVGGIAAAIGTALLAAGFRRRFTPELAIAAGGGALTFAVIDVVYVARRRISPVYLLDALAHVPLIAGWGVAAAIDRRAKKQAPPLDEVQETGEDDAWMLH